MIERRRLTGLGFLVLAVLLAWGDTVDPAKAPFRWIFVAAFGWWGLVVLLDRLPWLRERDRIEKMYPHIIMLGVAIAAMGWFIPASGNNALIVVGGLLVVLPLGLWILAAYQRRQRDDDTHRPR